MTEEVRVLLVDDEPPCREALRAFLRTDCPEVRIAGEAGSVAEAVRLLSSTTPDLVLLDVHLEDGTGFDLLDRFPRPNFQVVFTTAFDEFALRAFRYSAVDYLLKPVDPAELVTAVRRVRAADPAVIHRQLDQLRLQTATRVFDRITLHTGDGLLFARTDELMHLEARGNFTLVYLENGERHVTSHPLAVFEEMLSCPPFFRTHQSHIVNTAYVRKLSRADGDSLILADKTVIPLARRRKEAFIQIMKG